MSIHVWDEVRGTRGFTVAGGFSSWTPSHAAWKSMGTVSNAANVIRLWVTLENWRYGRST
jgi:hypothetical protein